MCASLSFSPEHTPSRSMNCSGSLVAGRTGFHCLLVLHPRPPWPLPGHPVPLAYAGTASPHTGRPHARHTAHPTPSAHPVCLPVGPGSTWHSTPQSRASGSGGCWPAPSRTPPADKQQFISQRPLRRPGRASTWSPPPPNGPLAGQQRSSPQRVNHCTRPLAGLGEDCRWSSYTVRLMVWCMVCSGPARRLVAFACQAHTVQPFVSLFEQIAA